MEAWIIDLAMSGGPGAIAVLFVFLLFNPKISAMSDDIREIKEGKRWTETCESTHQEVDHRLERIEKSLNGKLGG